LGHLANLTDDDGQPLLGKAEVSPAKFSMEHKVTHLGEPRPTSLDGFISGSYQVAIECKFTEAEVGVCSRPLLPKSASNYATNGCDGSYSIQLGRRERCSLTEIGVAYWKYVPTLFKWKSEFDIHPCPVNKNYQLIRNILAVCVRPNGTGGADGTVSPQNGHVVLLYDERNPAFQKGGNGLLAFETTKQALKDDTLLKKCSWQSIISYLKRAGILPWLTETLYLKYGLE
jgi:hypothetical protein